jgi:hypothetical protein
MVVPDKLRQGIGAELFAQGFLNLFFVERGFTLEREQNLERVLRQRMLLKSGFSFIREKKDFAQL